MTINNDDDYEKALTRMTELEEELETLKYDMLTYVLEKLAEMDIL